MQSTTTSDWKTPDRCWSQMGTSRPRGFGSTGRALYGTVTDVNRLPGTKPDVWPSMHPQVGATAAF